jgi:hypothetical protein
VFPVPSAGNPEAGRWNVSLFSVGVVCGDSVHRTRYRMCNCRLRDDDRDDRRHHRDLVGPRDDDRRPESRQYERQNREADDYRALKDQSRQLANRIDRISGA